MGPRYLSAVLHASVAKLHFWARTQAHRDQQIFKELVYVLLSQLMELGYFFAILSGKEVRLLLKMCPVHSHHCS